MTTINKEEIQKFSKIADEWWDVQGKFKPLHMFNPTRIEYILDKITAHFNLDKKNKLPIQGLKVLDIGCGGGLISEPMTRLGASVTGIDASEKNIKVASSGTLITSGILPIGLISSSNTINGNILLLIACSISLTCPIVIRFCLKGDSALFRI